MAQRAEGCIILRYRFYSHNIGRFLSPSALSSGRPKQSLSLLREQSGNEMDPFRAIGFPVIMVGPGRYAEVGESDRGGLRSHCPTVHWTLLEAVKVAVLVAATGARWVRESSTGKDGYAGTDSPLCGTIPGP